MDRRKKSTARSKTIQLANTKSVCVCDLWQRYQQQKVMTSSRALVFSIMVLSLVASSMGTIEEDEKDCAEQLGDLAACIPFVSGTAKKPTQECCDDTKKVKANKPKCLCVLIKQSTDPSLGLPVNTTLALQMPSECNIDAKVSNCPALLNLAPNSADAKLFKEADAGSSSGASSTNSPSSSASSAGSSTSPSSSGSTPSSDSKATPSSNDVPMLKSFGGKSLLGLIIALVITWTFT